MGQLFKPMMMSFLPPELPVLLPAGSMADVQLAKLFSVVGVLAIPVGILALLLLYQLLLLAISSLECFNMAKYEVTPILQHCKNITEQLDDISTRVNEGFKSVEESVVKTVESTKPLIKGGEQLAESGLKKVLFAVNWVKSFFQ